MLNINELPPELIARAFEVGTLKYGVTYLPPLCLVCHTWNDIINSTPRLWGIISVDASTRQSVLDRQINKAKASPISLYVQPNTACPIAKLAELAPNWIYADIPTRLLVKSKWSELRTNLQELRLNAPAAKVDDDVEAASNFFAHDRSFARQPPKLRAFAAIHLPRHWVTPFIGPHTRSLELSHRSLVTSLREYTNYFSLVPNIDNLKLSSFRFRFEDLPTVLLSNLQNLHVDLVENPAYITSCIRAPNLQALCIEDRSDVRVFTGFRLWSHPWDRTDSVRYPLTPLLSQWSQPDFLPSNLLTLELSEVLQVDDIPYLIRWLTRLPNLVRLTLRGDAIGAAATLPPSEDEERSIFTALASPSLCPMLLELKIETGFHCSELISVVQTKGCNAPSSSGQGRLRYIEAPICPSEGSAEELTVLKALVDEVVCGCLGCQFNLAGIM